jgi:signal transduction histidine kinase
MIAGQILAALLLAAAAQAAARTQRESLPAAAAAIAMPRTDSVGSSFATVYPATASRSQRSPTLQTASGGLQPILKSATESGEAQTPVYQTWYFYLALLFIGITLPAHLFRRRMLLMKGRIGIVLEERNRIARECHDTLMAGFAAISWQLEATARLFHDSGMDASRAAESCELARSMVAHCQAEARRIIWDLRETDEITSILSQALARSLAANQVQKAIETTLEVEGEEIPLAPGCVHHLVCIGQEAVTNAIRHASPSRISVHLQYESDALCLSIRDNGRGFQPPVRAVSRHGHFGIPVMQERSRKIGGAFRIQGLPGHGTEVTVRVGFKPVQQPSNSGQHSIRWIGI